MRKSSFISNFRILLLALFLFLISGVLFLQISKITQDGTQQIVRIKRDWVRQKDAFISVPGRDTVLFMGNSRVIAGVIPALFDQENGDKTHSYNLALPALPLSPHYFLLNDFLKNNKPPQYIILAFNPGGFKNDLFPTYALQGAGLGEIIQYSLLRKDAAVLTNYLFPWRFYLPEVKRYFKGKLLKILPSKFQEKAKRSYIAKCKTGETYPHDWSAMFEATLLSPEKSTQDRLKRLREDRGYYFIAEQAALGDALPDDFAVTYEPPKQLDKSDPFIDKFFSLTEQHGIKVILVSTYAIANQMDQLPDVPELWSEVKAKYKGVDYSQETYLKEFYEPKYFSDPVHVNQAGAERFTKKVAGEFKEIVGNRQ